MALLILYGITEVLSVTDRVVVAVILTVTMAVVLLMELTMTKTVLVQIK